MKKRNYNNLEIIFLRLINIIKIRKSWKNDMIILSINFLIDFYNFFYLYILIIFF